MTSRGRTISTGFWLSLAFTLAGCTEPLPTAAKPCPCAAGYVCCESGVCASEEAACGAATSRLSIEAQGHWTGYVENPEPTLGSDALDLTFEVGADGALHGRVIFGEGPPPPPPTDPHMVWPEPGPGKGGLVYLDAAAIAFSLQQPVVGVPLTARDIRWQAGRLRFSVNMREAWAPWCDLQTPYPSLSRGGYTCAPDIGPIMVATDGTTHLCYANSVEEPAFDCRWSVACNAGICDCTASACAGVAEPNSDWPRFRFDIALRGDEGDGSLEMFNVRLVRASR